MKKLKSKKMKDVLNNERGQGMLEYVLILVIVLAIAGLFRTQIQQAISSLVGSTSSQITSFGSQQ